MDSRHARPTSSSTFASILSRLGQEIIWAFIAALFCVVELAVKVTEFPPLRFGAARANVRGRSERPARGAFAR